MFDQMMQHYVQFMEASKGNPLVASALGMGLAGSAVYFLKQTPKKIYQRMVDLSVMSVTISNTYEETNYNNYGSLPERFLDWVAQQPGLVFSNNYRTKEKSVRMVGSNIELTAGHTKTYFIYRGRLFWYDTNKMESSGVSFQKMEITINTFGRNKKVFSRLMNELRVKHDNDDLSVKVNQNGSWRDREVPKRALNTVIINKQIKDELVEKIQDFLDSKEFYRSRGMPYKLTILLYGEPGTGKTSLLKALASHFNKSLYWMNLAEMSDSQLRSCLPEAKDNFLVAEDIHATDAIKGNMSKTGGFITPELTDVFNEARMIQLLDDRTKVLYRDAYLVINDDYSATVADKDDRENVTYLCRESESISDKGAPRKETLTLADPTSPRFELIKLYNWLDENDLFSQITGQIGPLKERLTTDNKNNTNAGKLTLSGVLNAFDGIVPLDGTVTFFTANRIDDIDPAMMRSGRIDLKYYLGPLHHDEIVSYLKLMYPEQNIPEHYRFGKLMGCNLSNIYVMNHIHKSFEEIVDMVYKESNK